jgi:hypothetical protein
MSSTDRSNDAVIGSSGPGSIEECAKLSPASRHQSEQVADFSPESPADIVGIRSPRLGTAALGQLATCRSAAHSSPRHRPKPGSGPRRHDTRHHLIAPPAGTSLPAPHRRRPDDSEGRCYAADHPKSPGQWQLRRRTPDGDGHPPPTTPASASPTQAVAPSNPHRRQTARQPPRGPSLEAFGRRPSARKDGSRRAGIRNPSRTSGHPRRVGPAAATVPWLPGLRTAATLNIDGDATRLGRSFREECPACVA